MSGSGPDTLPDVWKDLPDVREWSGGRPGCPGVVGRLSWMSGIGCKALPDVREWSGGTPGCPEVVMRPFWMSGSGREPLPDVRQCS